MTVVSSHARRRWLVAGAVTAVLAALPVVRSALPVSAVTVDPEVLAGRIATSADQPYQGYVVSSGSAGLPSLPQLSDVTAMIDGDTTLRAWYASPTLWRVDQIGTGTERDLYQTPSGLYLWDYEANLLTEVVGAQPVRLPRAADLVPPELGRRLLAAATGAHREVLPARRVAGRTAVGLRLSLIDPQTTIRAVDIWADPTTGLPLQVRVTARGARTASLDTRFLQLTTSAPAQAVLTPPAARPGIGFALTRSADILGAINSLQLVGLPQRLAGRERTPNSVGISAVGTYGSGLDAFVALPLPRRMGFQAFRAAMSGGGVLVTLEGGEAVELATPLLRLVVLDSDTFGRTYLLAGFVDIALLHEAANELSTFDPGFT